MAEWKKDELTEIAAAGVLHISPFREDRISYGTPTWIWSVVVDGDVYVHHEGSRRSADPMVDGRIDDAYRAKYKSSPYLDPMINARARSATVKIKPL